jgi:inner membrane protein
VASAITHAVVGLAFAAAHPASRARPRLYAVSAACAVLPDVDAIGFALGVPYPSLLGHRGLTHALSFAVVVAVVAVALAFRDAAFGSRSWWSLCGLLFLSTASHGALDALTNGGLGAAFFSPFDTRRWFFPWRPIRVSPVDARAFFGARGLRVLASEVVWVWIPALALVALARLFAFAPRGRAREDRGRGQED